MFTKVILQNFRSFDRIEFDLSGKGKTPKPLVIVYGENGAGKSALMSAFVLLREVLNTLDNRDAYEKLLNQPSIFKDEDIQEMLRQSLMSGLRDIHTIIEDYRMIGSEDPIVAEFEFSIGGNIGTYRIELGNTEILHERLEYLQNRRRGVYFDCTPGMLSINSSLTTSKSLLMDIKSAAERFWGKHSMLAIITHELSDKSDAYGWDNIGENFYDVLGNFLALSSQVAIGTKKWNGLHAPIDVLDSPAEGKILKSQEMQLDIGAQIFTRFFSAVNSDIIEAYYQKDLNDKYIDYKLHFKKLVAGEYRNIPFFKESTGNHRLISVMCCILCACMGGIVIIDEADAGIHDLLFKKLLVEVQPLIQGQLIMTTHNTTLMETDFARDAVYILSEDNTGHKIIQCVSNYKKRTYVNNNIRNRYLNKDYGGVPAVGQIDFEYLLTQLQKMLRKDEITSPNQSDEDQ